MEPLKRCASRGYVAAEPPKDVMTRGEAARYLGLDVRTFDSVVDGARTPRLRTKCKTLFRRVDLDALFVAPER